MYWVFFSSRRRHTRCALVTGVQTCALPISASGAGIAFDVGVFLVTGAIATDAIAVRDAPLRLRPFHRLWSFRVRLSAGPYALAAGLIFPPAFRAGGGRVPRVADYSSV